MTVKLNRPPKEIRRIILSEQAEMKAKCDCHFSQEKTVEKIIRNWGKIKGFRINGVEVGKMVEEM